MTVAQRTALAASWLKEGGASTSNPSSAAHMIAARAARQSSADDVDASSSTNSSSGSEDEQSEALETWMVLEFCEKGSLQRALSQGRFKRRNSQQPDMVSRRLNCEQGDLFCFLLHVVACSSRSACAVDPGKQLS
jgi:hypothetical protein